MRFQVIGYKYHDFKEVKRNGNVILAKCTCCPKPRLAVYIVSNQKKIFFYHGYTEEFAITEFNSLVKRQSLQSQD